MIAGISGVTLGASVPAAHAAAPFAASGLFATQFASPDIVSINPATGVATGVLPGPPGGTGLNQIGITGDGGKLLVTSRTSIYEYTAATETWETTPRSVVVDTIMGGVDPRSGRFYFGGVSTSDTFTFATYNPADNSISPNLTTVTVPNRPGTNGDLAFDSRGNLYFAVSGPSEAQLYRVDSVNLGRAVIATPVGPRIPAAIALNALAFGADGYLYVGGGTDFLKVNPVTGAVIERRTLNSFITDLGSFSPPYTGELSVTLPGGRVKAADQFTVTMGGGGIPAGLSSTTSGTQGSTTVGPTPLLPGQPYSIALTPAGGTTLNDYAVGWSCRNPATAAVVASGQGATGQFTIPTGVTDVVCAFTAVPKPDANDDQSLGNPAGRPVTVNVTSNDIGAIAPTTVRILNGGVPVTTLAVPGEGVWSVSSSTGAITFTPDGTFFGNPTPITYRVADTSGNPVEAAVTVTFVPTAQDDISLRNSPGTVVVNVLANDYGVLDPASVRILDGGTPVTRLVVNGEGAWNVNPTTGAITFVPTAGFEGNPTPVDYRVTDTSGVPTEATVTVAFLPSAVDDESLRNPTGQPVTVDVTANDIGDLNPTTVRILDGGAPVTELVVPGQGTWSVNPTTGAITFRPVGGFLGNPTPIDYRVTDTAGETAEAAVTITFLPTAVDDESLKNPAGETVTVDVTGNDIGDLNPTTVRILDGGAPVSELVVPGQGTWNVNPTTGAITFTPAAGFEGNPTPINYRVTDTAGESAQARVTITYLPSAVDDESLNNPAGQTVTLDVVANDIGDLDPTTVRILDTGAPVSELVVAGEGTWNVNPTTGAITFAPEIGFEGDPTPIDYRVTDTAGNPTDATVTITYLPAAVDDQSFNNPTGEPVTVVVTANDIGDLDPTTVRILDTGAPVSELVVAGEGTWNVNPTIGAITFTPEAGFLGDPAPIDYVVSDTVGNPTQATVTITFRPTAVDDESLNNPTGEPVTVAVTANDVGDLDPTTVRILEGGTPVSELAVPGEGTWNVNPTTGAITFAPQSGFLGNPTPIEYVVTDPSGNATQATVTVTFLPTAVDDESLNNPTGQPVAVNVVANDIGALDPASVRVLDSVTPVSELVVAGEGTWNVNPTTGAITFTPEAGFEGNPTPIDYRVTDTAGNSTEATVTVTFLPDAVDDESLNNPAGEPVTLDVTANDIGSLDPATVRILENGAPVTELVVPGQGTWSVDPVSGAITFSPETGFAGDPTPISYRVNDATGNPTEATVTITFLPAAVNDQSTDNPAGEPVTVDVTTNDPADVDPTTVRIVSAGGVLLTELIVPEEGRWTVNTANGEITFTPLATLAGNPAPIRYQVVNAAGEIALAEVTVTFLNAAPGPGTDPGAPAGAPATGPLALTGSEIGGAVVASILATLVGTALVLVHLRRSRRSDTKPRE